MSKPKRDTEPTLAAETSDDTLRNLEAAIERLTRRLDLLYRYTVGDRTGWRYPLPSSFLRERGDEFPEPDYEMQGGPRKPQGVS